MATMMSDREYERQRMEYELRQRYEEKRMRSEDQMRYDLAYGGVVYPPNMSPNYTTPDYNTYTTTQLSSQGVVTHAVTQPVGKPAKIERSSKDKYNKATRHKLLRERLRTKKYGIQQTVTI